MSSQQQFADHAAARINIDRLCGRLEALGEIGCVLGDNGERGCSRLALTDSDQQGRDLVVTWMRDLGLRVEIDAIGNVIATLEGIDPELAPVMTGSHIDTVQAGGRFDGNLGVLAGLEAIESIIQLGLRPRRPIAVAFFTDEEGARFAPDMLGSLVYVGGMALEEAHDSLAVDNQARLGDELERIGYAGSFPCPTAEVPYAFVELHIEQGPILENEVRQIGVVEGVQGISWTELSVTGQSCHAGTTPMRLRHDAGFVVGAITTFVRTMVSEFGGDQVGTVGRVVLEPNLINVVASDATLTVDLRNTDDLILQDAERRLIAECSRLSDSEGVDIVARTLARFEPVEFNSDMIDLVETSAQRMGCSTRRMPSGAGHDAQMLARICPTAMIFTPSAGGLSHNIAEYTAPDDLERGANVLLQVLLNRAQQK